MSQDLAWVLAFIGTIVGVLLIAWWSDRQHRKSLERYWK